MTTNKQEVKEQNALYEPTVITLFNLHNSPMREYHCPHIKNKANKTKRG